MKAETVNRAFKGMMMVGGFLALACPWASGKAPKPATVLAFSETWVDKVACTGSNSQGDLSCGTYSGGKFTLTATITSNDFGAAIDPKLFDQNTTVDITLGEYLLSGTLGEDPKYVPGSTKAKLVLSGALCSANDNNNGLPCPTKAYETITLTMNKKEVTISISAETGTDANGNTFESAIDADSFENNGDSSGIYGDQIYFQMDLDTLSVSSSITPVVAKVATKDVTAPDQSAFTLYNVKAAGALPSTDLGQ